MEYQQLDASTRRALVRARIQEIEKQHFSLYMRINAPDAARPQTDQDQMVLATLETSLTTLRQMEKELSSSSEETPSST